MMTEEDKQTIRKYLSEIDVELWKDEVDLEDIESALACITEIIDEEREERV